MTSRYVIGTVLVVLGLAAAAPADVLYADVPVSDSETTNSIAYPNTSRNVAVAPDGTIYVVYRDSSSIRVARSTNRGQSFQSSVQVNASSLEAEIAADANGVVYVAWVQSSQATFSRSTDSGVSFSTPASLGSASGTVHMAVDAPYVYLITKNGTTLFRNSSSGAGAFDTTTVDSSRVYADVHVDPETGDLYVQTDDPTVRVFKSTDRGATFDGPHAPGGSISYSTTVLASTESGVFLYTCGSGSTALRIDVSDYSQTTLTFGTTTISQGRTLAVDAFSNVVDGYVDGSEVKYAISTDNGASFDTPVTIASASYLSLGLSRRYGDIVAVYEQGGEIFCTVYGGEITQAPTVDTAAVSDVTATSATCGGDVVADGGATVTARGVCWSTSANPTTADSKTTNGTGTGAFTSNITGLTAGTTYHVRAYATNSVGTSYGDDVEFTAGIAVTTSGGSAAYVIGGDDAVVDPDVEIAASDITDFMVSITGNFSTGDVLAYTGTLPGGVSASYAGTTGILSFSGTASAADWQALLRTVTFSSSSASRATRTIAFTAGGAIPFDGTGHFYEYSASAEINWTDARNAAEATMLFGLQGYLATITSQEENDFIRQKLAADAWIGGSDEAEEDIWKWVTGPESGTQFSDGSTPVGEQFANWNTGEPNNSGGTEHYAEIYSTDGVGKWNDLPDLPILDGYVAEYGGMPSDPSVQITDTRDVLVTALPTVTTTAVSDVTATGAMSGGNVTDDGGADVTARGVCWSTSANPTTADDKTEDGTGTGAFTSNTTGLSPGTTYHVRAYATNSVGTAYGGDVEFTTDTTPTVTTTAISSITGTTADSGGNVTADGGESVTARGVCWSTSANPTTADSKTTNSTGTGSFTSNITGLSANTTYHVRAYATNSVGTAYGSDVEFTTDTTPTVTTTAISSITGTTADSGGNVTADGGESVTARGVCWSTSANPTTTDSKTTDGTGAGSFTSNITGLSAGTTYHVRAYATNSVDTAYGSDVEFTTDTTPTVTTTAVSNVTTTTVDSGGNFSDDGGDAVTARGVCWSTSENPTTADDKTEDGTGTGVFASSITGLTASTTYYVRAYATNSIGTSYGNEVVFNTASGGGSSDYCPYDPYKTSPGVCGCGVADIDTDDDGTLDCNDDCPDDADKIDAGVCGCGVADTDTDGDGTLDCDDACPDDADKIDAGVCGCGVADIDTDGDGTPDCDDACPDDADKIDAGVCGCGVADTDTDGDGTPDCNDACPENPDKTDPGVYGCDGETTANEDETAEVNNDTVDALVEGFEEDTHVTVLTDDAGTTTLTTTDSDGDSVLTVSTDGLGDDARIDVSMDESGNPSVTMTDAVGATLTVNAMHYPAGIEIYGARDDQDQVVVGVTDDSGVARTVIVEAIGADHDIVINVIYNMPEQEAGQVVPGFDGTVTAGGDEMADADSVTIEAVGLLGSAVMTVALEYWEADYAGGDESELRLLRLDDETGQYLPAGTNDVGDMTPTQTLGDYGLDSAAKTVWAQVNELGTFAISPVDEDDYHVVVNRGPLCGAFGTLPLFGLVLVMGGWTFARHKAPTVHRSDTIVSMKVKRGVPKMNKGLRHTGLALLAVILLAANSGCDLRTLLPVHLLSFGAGWLLGQNNISVTTECYLNGDPIDCADVPD